MCVINTRVFHCLHHFSNFPKKNKQKNPKISSHSLGIHCVCQNCTAPGGISNMEGSNFCPLKGEPSTSQPFFSMSCTFCGEKNVLNNKYASHRLTKSTAPPSGLIEYILVYSIIIQFSSQDRNKMLEKQLKYRIYHHGVNQTSTHRLTNECEGVLKRFHWLKSQNLSVFLLRSSCVCGYK